MYNYSSSNHKYAHLWNKYRPAILKFMVDSSKSDQQYNLSKHEFESINQKKSATYSFVLRAHKGKAINDIKTSDLAKDLLLILQQSERAMQLMDDHIYNISMDKKFVLNISREDAPEEPEEEDSTEE